MPPKAPFRIRITALALAVCGASWGHAAVVFTDSFENPDTTVSTFGTALQAPAGYDFSAGNTNANGVHLAPSVATGSDTSGDGADDQVLRLQGGGTITTTAAQLNHSLSLGETVTMTFDYGNLFTLDSATARGGDFTVTLLAINGGGGETALASSNITFSGSEFQAGLDGAFELSHVVAGNAGDRLAFRIQEGGSGTLHTVFDNLVLDVVPEPSVALLGGLGALLLLRRRRD